LVNNPESIMRTHNVDVTYLMVRDYVASREVTFYSLASFALTAIICGGRYRYHPREKSRGVLGTITIPSAWLFAAIGRRQPDINSNIIQ